MVELRRVAPRHASSSSESTQASDGARHSGATIRVFRHNNPAHLEQLSVRLPEHGRRGVGTALVHAACEEARWAGHDSLTLCTYRDVPWNGPFYRRLGFSEDPAPPPHLARIRRHEQDLGLDRCGAREVLRRHLDRSSRA